MAHHATRRNATNIAAACLGLIICAGLASAQTDTQIPLNYNFHGMAHGSEAFFGTPSSNADAIAFRAIADRGLVWDISNPDAFGASPLIGFTGITYSLFNPLGYAATTAPNASANGLDCVHLGNRVWFRGQETSANPGTSTGNAAPWAPLFDLATLTGNGTTATATTASPHGLSPTQVIAIVGATPSTFCGNFTVLTTPDPMTFTFACSATGTAGGSMFCNSTSTPIVSALSANGTTVTATTVVNHGFAAGNTINISGASIAGFNGQYPLATAAGTSFTFANATTGTPTGTEILCGTCLHDGDQVTILQTPVMVDGTTQIGVLYHATNAGAMLAQFDAVLTFHDGSGGGGDTSVTARLAAPDWFGTAIDPPIISRFVNSQKRMTFTDGTTYNTFQGVANNDSASLQIFSPTNAGPNLNVIEGVVSVQKILDAGINVAGKQLTRITFRNALFNPLQATAVSFSGGVGTATMSSNSTFIVGEPIVISGVTPASYNGIYKVDALLGTTQVRFLAPGAPDGAGAAQRYANGLLVTNVTMNGTLATATTAAAHGLNPSDTVVMTGIGNTLTTAGYAGALGTYSISTVPAANTFTYPCITTGVTATAAHMQITGVGVGRGYAIFAATVRTSSIIVTCCDNAAGTCATAFNICNGATTQGPGTACAPSTCPAIAQCCNNMNGACTLIYGGPCPATTTQGGSGNSCAAGSNPCPASGACCSGASNQTCGQSLMSACAGVYSGDNTTCSPSNPCFPADDCGSTTLMAMVGQATLSGSTVGATTSITPTYTLCTNTTLTGATGGSDVWATFIPPATAAYEMDLCGSSYDTVLTVYSTCPGSDATLVGCNDDSTQNTACTVGGGTRSRIPSMTLAAGSTYYVRIAGYAGATGNYVLNIAFVDANGPGSCCSDATCTLTDSANCTSTFTGGGVCSPSPCASSGVCCRGATCTTAITTAGDCTASVAGALAGAIFAPTSACNAGGSATSPCCYPDYNKVEGVGVADIFDFLNDWFAGKLFANTSGDGSSGILSVQNIFDFLNAWFAGGC